MKKLLILFFVAAMCVPCYGSILVYKTSKTATVVDFAGHSVAKVAEKGYLVLDINLATQTVNEAQQVAYVAKENVPRVFAVTVVLYDDVPGYIFADYWYGNTGAVLSGKTTDGKVVGLAGQKIAKILKGQTLAFSDDLGWGTLSATLDIKLTKTYVNDDIADVVFALIPHPCHELDCLDLTPPEPNPMTWAIAPMAISDTQITMTATTATDAATGPVEYFFTNVTDTSHNSGWQSSAIFTDTELTPNTTYAYHVRARDSAPVPNVTAASADANATTLAVDTTCPDPNPPGFASAPAAISDTQITMTATTATDADSPPVKYYFTNVTDANHSSGWQISTTYIDTGLTPNTTYIYHVRARDTALIPNITAASADANATTLP